MKKWIEFPLEIEANYEENRLKAENLGVKYEPKLIARRVMVLVEKVEFFYENTTGEKSEPCTTLMMSSGHDITVLLEYEEVDNLLTEVGISLVEKEKYTHDPGTRVGVVEKCRICGGTLAMIGNDKHCKICGLDPRLLG